MRLTDKAPLISLCMIARDNEHTIGAALASARPWVDEIIVVDTGSIDRTADVAREHGARVEYFPWCDDFAAARNESLRYATCQWLFWMDTDDTLPQKCGQQIRQVLTTEVADDVMGFIMQVHCPHDSSGLSGTLAKSGEAVPAMEYGATEPSANGGARTKNESDPNDLSVVSEMEFRCATIVDHVKLIRNRKDLLFEGRIHEQILPSIRRAGGRVEWTDSYVVHSGADYSAEGKKRKLARDLRLLRKDMIDRPNHPFVLFNLGMTLLHQGNYAEACTCLQKCIELSTTDESHLRKAYVLLVDSQEGLGQYNEARRRCWEGLGRYPDDLELAFKLGRISMLEKRWNDAIEAFERGMKPGRQRYFASLDPEIGGFKSRANLAVCYSNLGYERRAVKAWMECLDHMPDFEDAWDGIIQASRNLDDPSILVDASSRMNDRSIAKQYALVCEAVANGAAGKADAGIDLFEKALALEEAGSFVLNEFARFLNENSRWERSIPVLKQLRELDPSNPSPHFNLGICLSQLGRHAESIGALQAALLLRPGHMRTKDLLSQCRLQLNRVRKNAGSAEPVQTRVVMTVCFAGIGDPAL